MLCVSAHWYLPATPVTCDTSPRTIHDFGGFPRELYEVQYPAPGDPGLARRVRELLVEVSIDLDEQWGLDHGPLVAYETLGGDAALSVPTPDHYLPLLYVIAQQREGDEVAFPVEGFDGGSVPMLSVKIG